jgi:hypothetical protein
MCLDIPTDVSSQRVIMSWQFAPHDSPFELLCLMPYAFVFLLMPYALSRMPHIQRDIMAWKFARHNSGFELHHRFVVPGTQFTRFTATKVQSY